MYKLATIAALVVLGVGGWFLYQERGRANIITPEPSRNDVAAEYKDLVKVYVPLPGDRVKSPLTIRGEARGQWFFEASFPIVLTDEDGHAIAEGYVTAQPNPETGEINWMTTEYVPFAGVLTFTKPQSGERGTLILKKDNPSGLLEHDDAFEFPVIFK